MITPFILAGAMAPVTVAGVATQTLAEALAGMAFTQIVRPGAPVIFGSFASSMSMQSGAPTFGTPEPALTLYVVRSSGPAARRPVSRRRGTAPPVKIADAQAAYESRQFAPCDHAGGRQLRPPRRRLAGGRPRPWATRSSSSTPTKPGWPARFVSGVDMSENGQALDAIRETGPGQHFLGTAHTLANFETAF